jgi:hypothetical protein
MLGKGDNIRVTGFWDTNISRLEENINLWLATQASEMDILGIEFGAGGESGSKVFGALVICSKYEK